MLGKLIEMAVFGNSSISILKDIQFIIMKDKIIYYIY
jgi:hypothetical protein